MPLVPHLPPPPAALCGSPTAPALTPPARPRASDAGGLDGADDAPLVSRRAPPLALPPAAHGPAAPAARPCGRVRGVLFAAVFLTPASREVLLAVLPARHPLVRGDHMILALRPTKAQLLALPLGAEVPLRIIGQAADSRAQALAADPPAWLPPTAAGATHVALSLAPGVRGREAGALLIDALQRAAAGCGAEDAFGGAAPGAYEHFSDPLELAGFVGVALESGERAFSLRALRDRGLLALTAAQEAAYDAAHGARLRSAASVRSAAHDGGGLGDFWGAVEGPHIALRSLGPPLPLCQAPLVALTTGLAAAASGSSCSPSGAVAYQGDSAALARGGRTSSGDTGSGGGGGGGSAASSSSGDGPVVYASAVHAGDWALVVPLLAEEARDEAGRAAVVMREGWVKDVVADEPYQPKAADAAADAAVAALPAGRAVLRPRRARGAEDDGELMRALSGGAFGELGAGGGGASAAGESGRDNLELWLEFERLKRQFGEALCTAIMEDCDNDFAVAIRTIKEKGDAAAAAGAAAAAAAAPPTPEAWGSPRRDGWGEPGSASPGAAATAAARVNEVVMLAAAQGVPAAAALELCATLKAVAPTAAVAALARRGGDVNAAAEDLLSGATSGATSGAPAAAPGNQAARSAGAGRAAGPPEDPAHAVALRRLQEMLPAVPTAVASAVLRQHHGDADAAARELIGAAEGSGGFAGAAERGGRELSEQEQLEGLRAAGLWDGDPQPRTHDAPAAEAWGPSEGSAGGRRGGRGGSGNGNGARGGRGSGNGRRDAHMYSDEELADKTQEELKALAQDLWRRAASHFKSADVFEAAAQDAILVRNDEAGMATLMARSRAERAEANRYKNEASRISYKANNLDKRNEWVIDLHGLAKAAAIRKVANDLQLLSSVAHSGGVLVRIITGKGLHSANGVPVLRAQVLQHLSEMRLEHRVDPANAGVVQVFLQEGGARRGSGDAGASTSYGA
ncbi:hypothetical protein MNEG_5240 [Monoraphidium neglectum]|uniref:Smr domain-containing protein n=1 Tax=Monoraphidium neglectum TaxID=145388 RepID=A0A0D2NB48_9CHLO|nr:hypothetical protein MNEG_5240 [Monoraphidium neglectum]KIZ02716.1 hypothetical protein MNEG_5240 [Monoraphidium neglectum]|eukprot:XP_013901735.1 hypothetical protein MNEG_5240 [Monoraphidium neglectum]